MRLNQKQALLSLGSLPYCLFFDLLQNSYLHSLWSFLNLILIELMSFSQGLRIGVYDNIAITLNLELTMKFLVLLLVWVFALSQTTTEVFILSLFLLRISENRFLRKNITPSELVVPLTPISPYTLLVEIAHRKDMLKLSVPTLI